MKINNLPRKSSNSLLVKEPSTRDYSQEKSSKKSKIVKSSSYLQTYFCLIFIYFFSIGVTNFIVNPQKLLSDKNLLNLKEEQPFEYWLDSSRYHKANELVAGHYNTLILGNSRAFEGLHPKHPSLAQYSTYNAGLPLANIYEMEQIFNYAVKKNDLKKIIIGLDLGQFSDRRSLEADFHKSRFAGKIPYLSTYLSNIFSIPYFTDSLKKIKFNLQDKPSQKKSDFRVVDGFKQRDSSYQSNPQIQFIKYAESFTSKDGYVNFPYSKKKLNILKRIIAKSREEGIEIQLFISPVHAWQLEFMEVSNTFKIFESWKSDLVNLIAENNQNNSNKSSILLWDFSGYNAITTESVPLDNDNNMQWYNDPCHYRKEVGDIILSTIFNPHQSNRNQIKDFGVLINRENIKAHLAKIRNQQLKYQKNQSKDIQRIKDIAQKMRLKK